MREEIKEKIEKVVKKLYPENPVEFSVDFAPANIDADFSSNIALILAKKLGRKPMEVAEEMARELGSQIAAPGFLNFKLQPEKWHVEFERILNEQRKYGTNELNKGKKARVEYVSANPTGPIHIGNARGGPYGEVICKILETTGYKVLREYLHNDVGGQVEKLGKTILYWCEKQQDLEPEFPEGGYQGEYPQEIAKAASKKLGENLNEKNLSEIVAFAIEYIFSENLEVMKKMGIEFDLIVKESELQISGKVEKAVEEVKNKKLAKEKDGALWFAPNDDFLQDREAVIIKSDGHPTYFASDIAYHKEKFTSGYDLVVDILGSNHHGHVPKLQALTRVFGFDPEHFKVLVYQYVRVKKGDEVVKMAKRAGNFITAKEVLDLVGKDSMIFFLLSTAVNTHMDFDLDLARDTSDKNPVYKVQYAHARIQSILVKSKLDVENAKLELIHSSEELGLIRELAKFPELVEEISETFNVHHLPHYLLGLAERFHGFYEKVKVITDDEELTRARLALVRAAQIVLANGLQVMGIEPLEKM